MVTESGILAQTDSNTIFRLTYKDISNANF